MKHTLSYNRQLFNVKAIAGANVDLGTMDDGTIAFVDPTTGKSVEVSTFDELPNKFQILQKRGGRIVPAFDCVNKNKIAWVQPKEYTPAVLNKWEVVIEHCSCIKSVRLNLHVFADTLRKHNGLAFGGRDSFVEVTPQELDCFVCGEAAGYTNNILTMLLYKKINATNSQLIEAKVETKEGTPLNTLKEIEEFIKTNKEANTTSPATDDKLLKLIIEAKEVKTFTRFNPYNRNEVFPVGITITPSLIVNDGVSVPMTEVTKPAFEIGDGLSLVAEEHDNIGYYENVGSYDSNGMHHVSYDYQFNEADKYDTITMEFDSPKMNRSGEADHKRFMLIFGSTKELRSDVFNKLKTALIKE